LKPTTPLKLSAIAFTLLWSGWMLWWSGEYDLGNIIILAVCGAIAGYVWYRVMRWFFRRMSLLPHDGIDPGANQ
jgi:glycopeptide antibiotics resistance protein